MTLIEGIIAMVEQWKEQVEGSIDKGTEQGRLGTEMAAMEVAGVKLSARQIETVSESIGAQAEQLQRQEEQETATQGLSNFSEPNQGEPKTFIVEMDGVQVGFQDGSWQEAKCGVIYELSQRV